MAKKPNKIIEGAREALAVARGEKPAKSIYLHGHRYVPADPDDADPLDRLLLQGMVDKHGRG